MNFTLDGGAQGAQAAGAGVGNAIKAFAAAPIARQTAEQDTALKLARIYNANMTGNKAGAEARGIGMTNDFRSGIDAEIEANPDMTPYEKAVRVAFKYAGPQYMQNWTKSAQGEKEIADISAIQADPTKALPTSQAYFAVSGKAPFDNVANTGRSLNQVTGEQVDANAVMAKLFNNVQTSVANENNQQGRAAGALADTRVFELNAAKAQGGDGAASNGKPLTNAQLRVNQDVDAARNYVKDLPRETVAAVMRKNALELSEGEKDILARIKKARTAKYGESNVPSEYNDALGLDKAIVERIIGALNNPAEKRNFFTPNRPMTEEEILAAQKSSLPASEAPNFAQYVAAAKQRRAGGAGNTQLTHDGLPARQNADGSVSTEISITVTDPRLNGGKPTNIPSLWGGQVVDQETAVANALATGKPYQSFGTIDQAVAAAKTRSNAGGAGANKNSPAPASSSTMEFKPTPDMLKVQADFKAGKLSRDEAKKKLKALGMPD
jgi:hypothetical protein